MAWEEYGPVSENHRDRQPFLLGDYDRVVDCFLKNWPGKVALVVGGSNDMRAVRRANKRLLREHEVKIECLHDSLWTRSRRLRSKCLLLATEALFSRANTGVLTQLDLVFDTCVCHRVMQEEQPDPFSAFGLCDVLQEFYITWEAFQRRKEGHFEYHPRTTRGFLVHEVVGWPVRQKWQRVQVDFMGFPLPDVRPNNSFWDDMLKGPLRRRDDGYYWSDQKRPEGVSFNSLPLHYLLEEATSRRYGNVQRLGLLLLVCASQLTSSAAMAPVFQQNRMLRFGGWTLWHVAGLSSFLRCYMTCAGKHPIIPMEVALAVMTLQSLTSVAPAPFRDNLENLENLDGVRYDDFKQRSLSHFRNRDEGSACHLSAALDSLLEELLRLMERFLDDVLDSLREWPYVNKFDIPYRSDARDSWARAAESDRMASFLKDAMRRAASAPGPAGAPTAELAGEPQGFMIPLNPGHAYVGCMLPHERPSAWRSAEGKIEVLLTEAIEFVLDWYGPSPMSVRDREGKRVAAFEEACLYQLVTALSIFRFFKEYDENLDSDDDDDEGEARQLPWVGRQQETIYEFQHRIPCKAPSPFAPLDPAHWKYIPMRVHFSNLPLCLLNPDAHASLAAGAGVAGGAVFALKRFVNSELMVLHSPLFCCGEQGVPG